MKMISTGCVTRHRKAFYNYEVIKQYESGIVLLGGEVKSIRLGQMAISEAFIAERNGELFMVNSYIQEYQNGIIGSYNTRRERKLLLRKKEIKEIISLTSEKRGTIIPLEVNINEKGFVKIKIGIGIGKKKHDKRQTIADREWERRKARILTE